MGRSVSICGEHQAFTEFNPECSCNYNEETETHEIRDISECDSDCGSIAWELYKECVIDRIKDKYPSMVEVANEWVNDDCRVLTENDHAQIAISEYGGCVSINLVSKADHYEHHSYDQCYVNMANAWVNRVANGFHKEFASIVRIGRFTNGESVYERVGVEA